MEILRGRRKQTEQWLTPPILVDVNDATAAWAVQFSFSFSLCCDRFSARRIVSVSYISRPSARSFFWMDGRKSDAHHQWPPPRAQYSIVQFKSRLQQQQQQLRSDSRSIPSIAAAWLWDFLGHPHISSSSAVSIRQRKGCCTQSCKRPLWMIRLLLLLHVLAHSHPFHPIRTTEKDLKVLFCSFIRCWDRAESESGDSFQKLQTTKERRKRKK